MDDGRGALTETGLSCGSCGTELPPNAKFCNECGAPITQVSRSAEYKQVTVLLREDQVVQGIWASTVLVEALLKRGAEGDVVEAQDVIDNLAKLPDDVCGVVRDIWLLRLRTLLAERQGDEDAYREFRECYRGMATSLGFEGHMQWAEAMA